MTPPLPPSLIIWHFFSSPPIVEGWNVRSGVWLVFVAVIEFIQLILIHSSSSSPHINRILVFIRCKLAEELFIKNLQNLSFSWANNKDSSSKRIKKLLSKLSSLFTSLNTFNFSRKTWFFHLRQSFAVPNVSKTEMNLQHFGSNFPAF